MTRRAYFLWLVVLACGANAEPVTGSAPCTFAPLAARVSLLDAVERALCSSPDTRQLWANITAQQAQAGVSRAAFFPVVNGGVGLTRSNTASATTDAFGNRIAPVSTSRESTLDLSWVLFDFGLRRANLDSARQLLAAAQATHQASLQTVFLSTAQAWYDVVTRQSSLVASEEAEQLARQSYLAAEALHKAGAGTLSDQLAAQTSHAQATLERVKAGGELNAARGVLAVAMGMPVTTSVTPEAGWTIAPDTDFVPAIDALLAQIERAHPGVIGRATGAAEPSRPIADIPAPASRSADALQLKLDNGSTIAPDIAHTRAIDTLIDSARQRHPNRIAAAARLQAAKKDVDSATAEGRPSIVFTAGIDRRDPLHASQEFDGGASHSNRAGVQLRIPLFDGAANNYRVQSARAKVVALSAELDAVEQRVALDVWQSYQALVTGTENLQSTDRLLDSATHSFAAATGRYKAGLGTLLELLTAQNALAGARQQRIQAMSGWRTARLKLAASLGKLGLWAIGDLRE